MGHVLENADWSVNSKIITYRDNADAAAALDLLGTEHGQNCLQGLLLSAEETNSTRAVFREVRTDWLRAGAVPARLWGVLLYDVTEDGIAPLAEIGILVVQAGNRIGLYNYAGPAPIGPAASGFAAPAIRATLETFYHNIDLLARDNTLP